MANPRDTLHPWDIADYLRTEEEIALFIEAAQQDALGDADFMAKVMEEVERARRLNQSRSAPDAENPEWTDKMIKESVGIDALPQSLQNKLRRSRP